MTRERAVERFLRCIAERESSGLTYWVVDDHDTMRIDLHVLAASIRETLTPPPAPRVALVEGVPEVGFGNPPRVVVTEAMVERAAKALCEIMRDDVSCTDEDGDPIFDSWEECSHNGRIQWKDQARAVLTAALADADAGGLSDV
jgi:hypothetical protein